MRKLLTLSLTFCLFTLSAQWTSMTTGTSNELRCVDAVDANVVYAAGANVLIKSTNGGANWANLPWLNQSNVPIGSLLIHDLHFFDTQTGIAVGAQASFTRVILRTTDGGMHWSVVVATNDLNGWMGGYFNVHFINNTTGWAVGTSGTVSKTTNGGQSWTTTNIPNVSHLYDVQFIDNQTGMVCGENNFGSGTQQVLAQTTNGGQTWNQWLISSGNLLKSLHFFNASVGIVADDHGYLFRLNDGANLANSTNVSMVDAATVHRLHFFDNANGFALTDFSIRKTTNAGLFWEQATLPLFSGQELRDFDFLSDGQTGFAVGKAGKAFRTTNGGAPLLPMAYFYPAPGFQGIYCKDTTYHFVNVAPQGAYTSQWFLDNQLVSNTHDLDISFPLSGASYNLRLRITGPNGFSDYIQTIQTPPDSDFYFGELEWTFFPPVCTGNTVAFRVNNPAPNLAYTAYVNDVAFESKYANSTGPLEFTTPPLTETSILKVEAIAYNGCIVRIKSDTLHAQVIAHPDKNSAVETSTPVVCLYDKATITIHDSETGAFYTFMGGFTAASPVEGNGGDLTFNTPPLFQTDNYQIIANRGPCSWPLNQTVHIEVDVFFNQMDTANLYGMTGIPIPVNNPTQGVGSVQWNFGPNATPSTSTSIEPQVVYAQSGLQPYTYTYQSQSACVGAISSSIPVYDQGPALGADCPLYTLEGFQWSNPGESPHILATATDTAGNLLTTGALYQPVGWWNTMNLYVQKSNPAGQMLWRIAVDPTGPGQGFNYRSSYGTGLATDEADHIYVCGTVAADQARIFDHNYTVGLPLNQYFPQGFLMKLGPGGDVQWNIFIQSLTENQVCAPSSLLYSRVDQRIYLVVHGPSWQAILPDGSLAGDFNANAGGWLLAFDSSGHFIEAHTLGDIPTLALQGVYHPQWISFAVATSTYISPRLREGPQGALYVGGIVYNLDTLHFSAQTAIATDLGDVQKRHHFMAIYDRNTSAWAQAFFTHSIGAYNGINDNLAPAWRVDSMGNVWIGLGLIAPESSGPGLIPTLCVIGSAPPESVINRGYLAQFSPNGQLNWVAKASNLYFHELMDNGKGGMYLLAGFVRAAGFQLPSSAFQGAIGPGKKDVLLAEFSGSGEALGFHALGTSNYDQPIAMTRHAASGQVYTILAPNLNQEIQSLTHEPFALHVYSPDGLCPVLGNKAPTTLPLTLDISPNPAKPGTPWSLQGVLPSSGYVYARVLDTYGREVWKTALGWQSEGAHQFTLAPDSRGWAPGVYQLELTTAKAKGCVRVVLVN